MSSRIQPEVYIMSPLPALMSMLMDPNQCMIKKHSSKHEKADLCMNGPEYCLTFLCCLICMHAYSAP